MIRPHKLDTHLVTPSRLTVLKFVLFRGYVFSQQGRETDNLLEVTEAAASIA